MTIVVDLTESEKKALGEAQQKGYLIRREKRSHLGQVFLDWCRKERRPFVEVSVDGRYAHIFVYQTQYKWGCPPQLQAAMWALGKQEVPRDRGFDVDWYGCSLYGVPAERAEAVAQVLYWLATDPRCDFSSSRN